MNPLERKCSMNTAQFPEILKAVGGQKGGKYLKRIPKPGGGYRYIYEQPKGEKRGKGGITERQIAEYTKKKKVEREQISRNVVGLVRSKEGISFEELINKTKLSRGVLGANLERLHRERKIFRVQGTFGPGGLKPSTYWKNRQSAIASGIKEKDIPRGWS